MSDTPAGEAPDDSAPDDVAARIQRWMDERGIDYRVMPCDPDLADTAQFCAHYGIAPEASGNTIIVAGKTDPRTYAACLVTATTRLDVNKAVRKLMGVRKASFASAEETRDLTGQEIGGVTVFALPDGVPLYVDDRIMELDAVWVGGGSRRCKIEVAPAELRKVPGMEIVPALALDA